MRFSVGFLCFSPQKKQGKEDQGRDAKPNLFCQAPCPFVPEALHQAPLGRWWDLPSRPAWRHRPGNPLSDQPTDVLFPLQPPPPPIPTNPPGHPTREGLTSVHFGSNWLRSGPFGSVLAPFRVRFGSVSGPLDGVGVGSVRGASVREKNITRPTQEPTPSHHFGS